MSRNARGAAVLVATVLLTAACADVQRPPAPEPVTDYPALGSGLCAALPFGEEAERLGLRLVDKVKEERFPVPGPGNLTTCFGEFVPADHRGYADPEDRWLVNVNVVVERRLNRDPFVQTTSARVVDRDEVSGWWGKGYSYRVPYRSSLYGNPVIQTAARIVTHHNLTADVSVAVADGNPVVLVRLCERIIDALHPLLPAPVTTTPATPTDVPAT